MNSLTQRSCVLWTSLSSKYRLFLVVLLLIVLAYAANAIILRVRCLYCINNNDLATLQRLVNHRKDLARAMLDDAYLKGNRGAFEVLLKAGANPDGIHCGRLTLIHAAARNPDSFWLDRLLAHGADPNYHKVIRSINPLSEAIEGNCPENVRLLAKAGADVNAVTQRPETMLTSAWTQRRGECAMILLQAGALVNPPSARHESFINKFQRMSYDFPILNDRIKTDEECMFNIRLLFREKGLDLKNATWDESQGDFGVWTIPPMPKQEPEQSAPPLEKGQSLATAPYDADKARQYQEEWASHINSTVEIANCIGMHFRLIPAGEFLMGSIESDITVESNAKPIHKVRLLRPYYLGTTEVTQKQWLNVMNSSPWIARFGTRNGDDYPATYVSHEDSEKFCQKLSKLEGKTYRLPTEAEWEHACRAGTTTRYSFDDDGNKLPDFAWYQFNVFGKGNFSKGFNEGEDYPRKVGLKKPNPFGLFDMHGNVFEWCSDRYSSEYYIYSRMGNPIGPPSGLEYSIRSSSWRHPPAECRSASRGSAGREQNIMTVGFRVVREP